MTLATDTCLSLQKSILGLNKTLEKSVFPYATYAGVEISVHGSIVTSRNTLILAQ